MSEKAYCKPDNKFDAFDIDESAAGVRQSGYQSVSILNNAVCNQYAQRQRLLRVECNENQMRAGYGQNTDKAGR